MSDRADDRTLQDIYLDTSVVVAAIVAGSENAQASLNVCNDLIRHRVRVYFSTTLRIELLRAVRKLATRANRLDDVSRTKFALCRWGADPAVRRRWIQHHVEPFAKLPAAFAEVYELDFDEEVWLRTVETMGESSLQAQDAVRVATARGQGIASFATLDADNLRIWGSRRIPRA